MRRHQCQRFFRVAELRKVYGRTAAVDGVSFDVHHNEIVGLLGPNGAGKTTTINMILGVLEPSGGTIHVEGLDIAENRSQALERTNFAAAYAPLPGNLTVYQNLRVFGLIYEVEDLTARITELLKQFDLEKFREVKCGVLSSGEQTRVSLAKAMLNRPHLLLLDEPTASLDPAAARDIATKIRELVAQSNTGVSGHPTTCTKLRLSAIGYSFSLGAGSCLKETPRPCPASTAKKPSKKLFVTVAREPLKVELG